jgi:acetyltransferase-like isoleucine patch superfamily enzyme
VLAGGVTAARGAFVGAGAVCAPNVAIGANSVVGAGAVVVRDVPPDTTVIGNPARVLRRSGDGYGGSRVPLAP